MNRNQSLFNLFVSFFLLKYSPFFCSFSFFFSFRVLLLPLSKLYNLSKLFLPTISLLLLSLPLFLPPSITNQLSSNLNQKVSIPSYFPFLSLYLFLSPLPLPFPLPFSLPLPFSFPFPFP